MAEKYSLEEYEQELLAAGSFARLTHSEGALALPGEFGGAAFEVESSVFELGDPSQPSVGTPCREAGNGSCMCGCAHSEGEAYSSPFALGMETNAFAHLAQGETSTAGQSDCAVDCLAPPPKEVVPMGRHEGAYIERTQGDPQTNFALQLFDYDKNAFQPTKAKHAEALALVSEFISKRLAQTSQDIAVTITGLASRTGTADYNLVLSCKRAKCVAANLQSTFSAAARARVQLNTAGEGFTRSTCNGAECELGEWRSVLVQVHAPGDIPPKVHPVDPGSAAYNIRCCSYHSVRLVDGVLGELLAGTLPGVPPATRKLLAQALSKFVPMLLGKLLGKSRTLSGLGEGFKQLMALFPAEFLRETGVFEVKERVANNARGSTYCYSGFGLRLLVPNDLDALINQVPLLKELPESLRRQLTEAIRKSFPSVGKRARPIGSDTPGPFARFDLLHPRNLRVFEGRVTIGKGIWAPGQINVEFESAPWHIPDPIKRPHIIGCPDTACNDAGVQTVVGDGGGFDFFAVAHGDFTPGSCVCSASSAQLRR